MNIFSDREGMTRRQFFKGTGLLLATAVVTGIFAKLGFDASAASDDYINKRIAGMYTLDESMTLRKSHLNPEIAQIYKDFLSPGEVKPLTEKSERLLHTKYGKDIPALIEELKKPGESGTHQAA
ncbi:MAG TPA: iron hydrogenase small subunit [Syntrophomonadaceae bacterium]|nr:iron hydrogenase small subunit [Syntrophomonadaceae bacterium]